jgi:hypothetical protein
MGRDGAAGDQQDHCHEKVTAGASQEAAGGDEAHPMRLSA